MDKLSKAKIKAQNLKEAKYKIKQAQDRILNLIGESAFEIENEIEQTPSDIIENIMNALNDLNADELEDVLRYIKAKSLE